MPPQNIAVEHLFLYLVVLSIGLVLVGIILGLILRMVMQWIAKVKPSFKDVIPTGIWGIVVLYLLGKFGTGFLQSMNMVNPSFLVPFQLMNSLLMLFLFAYIIKSRHHVSSAKSLLIALITMIIYLIVAFCLALLFIALFAITDPLLWRKYSIFLERSSSLRR